MTENKVILKEKQAENNLTERKYFVWENLYYPIVILLLSSFLGLVSNIVISKQQIRSVKIETISELTKNFSDYYYHSGVRSMIHFEKYELVGHFADTIITGINIIELSIRKRLELEDSLKKKYPIAYNLMLDGDMKVSNLSKSLMLAQLYFSKEVRNMVTPLQDFIPIDKSIDQKINERLKTDKSRLSEHEKNIIMTKIFYEMESKFQELINQMNAEK